MTKIQARKIILGIKNLRFAYSTGIVSFPNGMELPFISNDAIFSSLVDTLENMIELILGGNNDKDTSE